MLFAIQNMTVKIKSIKPGFQDFFSSPVVVSYLKLSHVNVDFFLNAGEDPGFPLRGGTNHQEGVPSYDFAKVFQKTAWNREIFGL